MNLFFYVFLGKIFGFTFAVKQMELSEERTQKVYLSMIEELPEAKEIIITEKKHENLLIEMLDEEKPHYLDSIVLGLNDALLELTGTLAGLTLAMQKTNRLIALSGIITGVSATFSMAASEF